MTRACRRSSLPRPYIWRLTSLSFVIWPSVCPLDHADEIAAQTAALSLATPFANEATKLDRARSSHGSKSASDFARTIAWKSATIPLASTSIVKPPSIAATTAVSAFERLSRPTVNKRAMVRADGTRVSAPASLFSACLRRAAHSATTRRHPRKPCCLRDRHSFAPLRRSAAHGAASHGG